MLWREVLGLFVRFWLDEEFGLLFVVESKEGAGIDTRSKRDGRRKMKPPWKAQRCCWKVLVQLLLVAATTTAATTTTTTTATSTVTSTVTSTGQTHVYHFLLDPHFTTLDPSAITDAINVST